MSDIVETFPKPLKGDNSLHFPASKSTLKKVIAGRRAGSHFTSFRMLRSPSLPKPRFLLFPIRIISWDYFETIVSDYYDLYTKNCKVFLIAEASKALH